MKKKELKEEIKKVLEGKSIYEMSPISGLNPMTKEEIIYWIVETYIDQELDKAREEEIQKILDKMPQYVERNGREYYLDFYIKDISGERYYCSCYTNGDKKLTPEYDEEILLRSLVKTRDYLSKLKQ